MAIFWFYAGMLSAMSKLERKKVMIERKKRQLMRQKKIKNSNDDESDRQRFNLRNNTN